MRNRKKPLAVAALLLTVGCRAEAPKPTSGSSAPADPPEVAAQKWRDKHEADYRRDWVSIAGLHALKAGPNSAGSAAANDIVLPASTPPALGRFVLTGDKVRFEPAPGVPVRIKDKPVTAPLDLKDDAGPGADELLVGDVRLVVHVSGEHRGLRVRDPNGPLARGFLGFSWFPIESKWRVTGRLIRDPQPQKLQVLNTYNDIDEYQRRVVEFTLLGETLRLGRSRRGEAVLLRVSRRVERPGNLRDSAVPVLGSPGRRDDRAGFQRGLQPAVRVQSAHHLSDSAEGEPADREDPCGREGLSRPPADPGRRYRPSNRSAEGRQVRGGPDA